MLCDDNAQNTTAWDYEFLLNNVHKHSPVFGWMPVRLLGQLVPNDDNSIKHCFDRSIKDFKIFLSLLLVIQLFSY